MKKLYSSFRLSAVACPAAVERGLLGKADVASHIEPVEGPAAGIVAHDPGADASGRPRVRADGRAAQAQLFIASIRHDRVAEPRVVAQQRV